MRRSTIKFDYVKLLAIVIINYDLISSQIGQKVKGEFMHENGFEFEANLKHYQQAVSLLTSLACSIRI